jgi:hypothetical protein
MTMDLSLEFNSLQAAADELVSSQADFATAKLAYQTAMQRVNDAQKSMAVALTVLNRAVSTAQADATAAAAVSNPSGAKVG